MPASPSRTTTADRPPVTCSATARTWSSSGAAAHQGVHRRARRRRGRCGQHRPGEPLQQPGVLAQHGLLEVAQLGARVDAQLVAEQLGAPAAGLQGVGLPVGGVERGDEPGPQPLAQRVRGDEVLQVGDGRLGPAQGQQGVAAPLAGAHLQLGQPQPVARGGREVAQLGQRLAAPQRQRLVQQRDAALRGAVGHRAVAGLDQLAEGQQVQVGGVGVDAGSPAGG